jgi:hypothetical protein
MTPRSTGLRALFLLLLLLTGLVACGKREWPTPVASEDRFRWRSVQVMRSQACVIVNMEASGTWQNIGKVNVLLEPVGTGPDDGCASCPFSPRLIRSFSQGDAGYRRDMNRLVLTVCDLEPNKTYRLQVVGYNIFPTLGTVLSDLMLAAPQSGQ